MLSYAGDFNHDGIDDMLVGDSFNPTGEGTAFIFYGKNSGFKPLYNRSDIYNVVITDTFGLVLNYRLGKGFE